MQRLQVSVLQEREHDVLAANPKSLGGTGLRQENPKSATSCGGTAL